MSVPPERPSFRQIYLDQYRKDSASTTTRVLRITSPVGFLILAVFARHSPAIAIFLGVLAVVLFVVAIAWDRRQRRNRAVPPESGVQPGRGTGPA
jgi:FtsH-binding integral membrane protein